MATYIKTTDFLAKDSLPLNNAAKYVKGSEIDTEFNNIATADADNMKKSAMGTGVETFLGTPSSANLAAAVTGETGTGALVFATSPTLVTPVLGAAAATSIAIGGATAISSQTGTGGVVVMATSPTLVTPTLGTPASGTLTNCTGLPQAGTVGLTTADSPEFAAINLGHASDTTLTRVSAGVAAVEGSNILLASGLGSITQAYDADILKADTADVLTAGYAGTPYNAGTKSSGTFTPDEANGNMQYCVNGGAFTLAPPTNNTTIVLQVTNNGSAGAITTSGFTKVSGDILTTTNGNDYFFFITKCNGFSHLAVQALQ